MTNPIVFRFLEELRLQCRFGKFAYDNLRTSLQAMDPEKTFFYAQALLGHACQVSRLLWPAQASSNERGERLRKELGIGSESPANLRELRGHLEASDERLEEWLGAMERPEYLEFNIMPQGSLSAFKQDTFQRSLDPDMYMLVFRGESWDLRRLADELRRIEGAAQGWLRTHNPW